MDKKVINTNRKAFHRYSIIERCEAGIVLAGYETKSIRGGHVDLTDGHVTFHSGEAHLTNIHIAPYAQLSTHVVDYAPRRSRKLLMHKEEIKHLAAKVNEKGFAVVPLEMYFSSRGIIKVTLGLGKGKKTVDKRDVLRQKDIDRDTERELRSRLKK